MKIYEVTIEELMENEELGLRAISIVSDPAVEKSFLKFHNEEKEVICFSKDEEKHIITGVALLADTPIFRFDKERGEYYVVFPKETLCALVEKYNRDGLLNMVNFQHDARTYTTEDCTLVESFFVDKERGICPIEFADVTDGSWIVSYKVNNDALWEEIKNGGNLNGFSVEVLANIMPMIHTEELAEPIGTPNFSKTDAEEEYLRELVDVNLSVRQYDVRELMKDNKQVVVIIGDEEVQCQINSLGTKEGSPIINVYIPKTDGNGKYVTGKWDTYKLADIKAIHATDIPFAPFVYTAPGYKEIVKDESNIVVNSVVASRENIITSIKERIPVMLEYDDEEDDAAKGERQIEVVCYGYSLAGNEIFRAFQYFGDTKSESPAWKLFLTKRCKSFRIMTEFERYSGTPGGQGAGTYHVNDVDIPSIIEQLPGDLAINPR